LREFNFFILLLALIIPPLPQPIKRKQPTGRADMLMAKVVVRAVLPPLFRLTAFKYPMSFPSNNWRLVASSNLHDWYVYPESQYYTGSNYIIVTNQYPQMFFRIWNP
jgi:hypothetical protein